MIGYLKGELLAWQSPASQSKPLPTKVLLINVQGVGYEVIVTQRTASGLARQVELFIHTQLREEAMQLYGFLSLPERDLFRQLVSVAGVGSQMAMALLDALPLPDLVRAIITNNSRLLCLAQGVGNKTAQRLCLELRAKLSEWRTPDQSLSTAIPSHLQADIELALLALGYSSTEINQALAQITIPPHQQDDIEVWLKVAIAWLNANS
ncbi:MAG: Holliday junction branch migration protein RuvA [Pseudanabaenaceae cyanobacterium]